MPTTATPQQFADYLVSGWFQTYAVPVLGQGISGRHSWGPGATVAWSPELGSDFSTADLDAIAHALRYWSEVADVNFVPREPGTGQIRFVRDFSGLSQEHQFVSGDRTLFSQIRIDPEAAGPLSQYGGPGFVRLIHETGHSMGLGHAGPYEATHGPSSYEADALFTQDSFQYTVMSYFSPADAGLAPTVDFVDHATGVTHYPQTPMLVDVLAVQDLYGAQTGTRDGDTTYGFNASADITGSAADADIFDFSRNVHPILTIWDGGGTNTLDLSGFSMAQRVDLHPGSYSDVGGLRGNIAIASGSSIQRAIGGSGDDLFILAGGHVVVAGGGGNDSFEGLLDDLNDVLLSDYSSGEQIVVLGSYFDSPAVTISVERGSTSLRFDSDQTGMPEATTLRLGLDAGSDIRVVTTRVAEGTVVSLEIGASPAPTGSDGDAGVPDFAHPDPTNPDYTDWNYISAVVISHWEQTGEWVSYEELVATKPVNNAAIPDLSHPDPNNPDYTDWNYVSSVVAQHWKETGQWVPYEQLIA